MNNRFEKLYEVANEANKELLHTRAAGAALLENTEKLVKEVEGLGNEYSERLAEIERKRLKAGKVTPVPGYESSVDSDGNKSDGQKKGKGGGSDMGKSKGAGQGRGGSKGGGSKGGSGLFKSAGSGMKGGGGKSGSSLLKAAGKGGGKSGASTLLKAAGKGGGKAGSSLLKVAGKGGSSLLKAAGAGGFAGAAAAGGKAGAAMAGKMATGAAAGSSGLLAAAGPAGMALAGAVYTALKNSGTRESIANARKLESYKKTVEAAKKKIDSFNIATEKAVKELEASIKECVAFKGKDYNNFSEDERKIFDQLILDMEELSKFLSRGIKF